MNQLIPKLELNIPNEWDYQESVEKVKGFIYKWKNLTYEIGAELFIAKIKTFNQGARTDITSELKFKSWEQYCIDIGSQIQIVTRWMKRLYPSLYRQLWPKTKLIEKGLEYIDPDIRIIHGDFREVCETFEDESIDHIITDPPYPEEYLPLWVAMAEQAERILKHGGFCITLSGKTHLPQIYMHLEDYLSYYWTGALLLTVPAGVHPVKINTLWKPILIHYKEPKNKQENYVFDVVKGQGREKDSHEWQQSMDFSDAMIERFTRQGEHILDPFGGSGTTALSCKKLKRRCTIIDIDENCINIINERLLSYDISS